MTLYRVQWLQRLQPTDEHRTIMQTDAKPRAEAERITREMQDNPAYENIEIVEAT